MNIAESIKRGLEEAVAYARGEDTGAREMTIEVSESRVGDDNCENRDDVPKVSVKKLEG